MVENDRTIQIIGIDCATTPQRTGISLGTFSKDGVSVQEALICSQMRRPEDLAVEWVNSSKDQKTLIAIDAPLGWPLLLTTGLVFHAAGTSIQGNADKLFFRRTEQMVLERFGIRPLAVGADRIARTAHAALALIESIRRRMNAEIPLVRANNNLPSISLIEVYPAATLRSYNIIAGSYKKPTETDTRRKIVGELAKHMRIESTTRVGLVLNSDVLDSVVCLLAGADFLRGECIEPECHTLAEKEGWIWVKKPNSVP